jgi:hypothetical protein
MSVAGLTPIEADIVNSAETYGVDPRLALSVAQVESGLNPVSVGDQGTSFGLYQLHQGGELGSLSAAQAFNPVTNANTALSVVGQVSAAHPGADPGAVAAAAQRPADPGAYAAAVDAVYSNPADFPQVPASTNAVLTSSNGGGTGAGIGSAIGGLLGPGGAAIGGAIGGSSPGALLTSGWGKTVFQVGLYIVFALASLGLILLGLTRLFPGVSRTVTTALPLAAA